MRKSITSVIIAVLLSLSIITFVSVPAFAEGEPRFELTTVNGNAGETVKMKLNINNNPGITALSVLVAYSDKDLELVNVESAGLFDDGISTGVEGTNPIKISWYASDSGNKTDNGTLALLSFKIKANAKTSDVKLSYNPEDVFDNTLDNKKFSVVNGKVYIGDIPKEDSPKSVKNTNPVKVTVKSSEIKLKKLKKKAQTVKAITVKKAQGKVTYKLVKKGSMAKIFKLAKINAKGIIKLNKWKKAKKGDYKLKVAITAAGNKRYKPKTVKKIIRIKLK